MKRWLRFAGIIAAMVLVLAACSNKGATNDSDKKSADKSDKIEIKTTVYPLKSFAEQIGGEHVKVDSIYPSGTDLHDYEPTQKDMIKASESDLFIYTGD